MYRSYMDTSISFHKHQKYNSKQMTFIRRFNLGLIFVIYSGVRCPSQNSRLAIEWNKYGKNIQLQSIDFAVYYI